MGYDLYISKVKILPKLKQAKEMLVNNDFFMYLINKNTHPDEINMNLYVKT